MLAVLELSLIPFDQFFDATEDI